MRTVGGGAGAERQTSPTARRRAWRPRSHGMPVLPTSPRYVALHSLCIALKQLHHLLVADLERGAHAALDPIRPAVTRGSGRGRVRLRCGHDVKEAFALRPTLVGPCGSCRVRRRSLPGTKPHSATPGCKSAIFWYQQLVLAALVRDLGEEPRAAGLDANRDGRAACLGACRVAAKWV